METQRQWSERAIGRITATAHKLARLIVFHAALADILIGLAWMHGAAHYESVV